MRSTPRSTRLVVTMFLTVALAACASAGGGQGGDESSPRMDPNRISLEELQRDPARDLYQAIQSLRPRWLRPRGASMSGPPSVILDGIVQPGGAGILSNISVLDVQSVTFMSAIDATTRYGLDMIGGAIVVERDRR